MTRLGSFKLVMRRSELVRYFRMWIAHRHHSLEHFAIVIYNGHAQQRCDTTFKKKGENKTPYADAM